MRLMLIIMAGVLTAFYFPLFIGLTMAVNDAVVSTRACNWVMAEIIFHGLAIALLWLSILM